MRHSHPALSTEQGWASQHNVRWKQERANQKQLQKNASIGLFDIQVKDVGTKRWNRSKRSISLRIETGSEQEDEARQTSWGEEASFSGQRVSLDLVIASQTFARSQFNSWLSMVTLSKETGTEKSIQMWKTLHISLSSCRSSQSDLQQSNCAEKLFELCWLMPWQTKFALISFVIMIVEMWSWWCWESWRSSFGGRLQFCSLWLSLGVTKVVKKGFGMFKVAATQQLIHCWWMLIIIVSKESIKGSFGFVRKEMVHLVSDARGCEKKWECRSTCSRACDEFEVGCCVSSASRLLVHPCVNLSFRNIFVWSVERFTWNLWRWAVARFKGWNQNWMARAIREIDACSVKQLGKQFSSDFASADFQSNFRTISVAISPWFAHACWWTVGTAFTVFFTNCLFQLQFFVFFTFGFWSLTFLIHGISHWAPSPICQRASCATCGRDPHTLHHEWLSTDETRSRTMQRHWDDLKRLTQQELTLSTFHTMRSLIGLAFIASHLVCHSTMTSLDLQSDRLWAQARC